MNTKQNLLKAIAVVAPATTDMDQNARRVKAQTRPIPNRENRGQVRQILNILFISFAFAMLCLGSTSTVRADVSQCDSPNDPDAVCNMKWGTSSGITMKKVDYVPRTPSTINDQRASRDDDGSYYVRLRGRLYYEADKVIKDAPVLIYNHGHDKAVGELCAIVKYFVNKGFVVFAPLRRGHRGREGSGIQSTGIFTDDYVSMCMRSALAALGSDMPHLFCGSAHCRQGVSCTDPNRDNAFQADYIRSQREDVREQIRYIKEQPAIKTSGKLADPKRIAILGHSFGGSLTIFSNEHDYGQNVVIDVSGAELSWGDKNPFWEIDLKDAMLRQKQPMYFLQPKNGRKLEPTKVLFSEAVNKEYRSQAAIFPPAPWDPICSDKKPICFDEDKGIVRPEWRQAHGTFIVCNGQVQLWGPSVIDFINRNPRP